MSNIIIIGAGLTGLTCARYLKRPYRLFEQETAPGGLCSSVSENGFVFDYSGHFLHLHTSAGKRMVNRLLSDNFLKVKRKAAIHAFDKLIPYPFQANLYFLPKKIRSECLSSFLAVARKKQKMVYPNYFAWSKATFGEGITHYFMQPYTEKLWSLSAHTLTNEWIGQFVPRPSILDVQKGAKAPQNKSFGYNTSFVYPAHGGIQSIIAPLVQKVQHIECGVACQSINSISRLVRLSGGREFKYSRLISTQPLPDLLDQIEDLPSPVREARKKLAWNSVSCLNIGFRPKNGPHSVADKCHWIYFPEKRFIFYRVGIFTNIAPSMAPEGCASIYVETSFRPGKRSSVHELRSRVLSDLRDAGIIKQGDRIETVKELFMPCAYVMFNRHRTAALKVIRAYLKKNNIYSIGRYGAWEYSFMEKNMLDAKALAEKLNKE